jgi:hypothetical protein
VDALMGYVPGPQDALLLGKSDKLACCSILTLRRFTYGH